MYYILVVGLAYQECLYTGDFHWLSDGLPLTRIRGERSKSETYMTWWDAQQWRHDLSVPIETPGTVAVTWPCWKADHILHHLYDSAIQTFTLQIKLLHIQSIPSPAMWGMLHSWSLSSSARLKYSSAWKPSWKWKGQVMKLICKTEAETCPRNGKVRPWNSSVKLKYSFIWNGSW